MKVLTAEEMKACDAHTFTDLGVPSRAVMESAGRGIATAIETNFLRNFNSSICVVGGGGNNGGDGYVIARALKNIGREVTVLALKPISALSGEARSAAEAWTRSSGKTLPIDAGNFLSSEVQKAFTKAALIVDAIFGTGFKGEVKGFAKAVIQYINELPKTGRTIVSVDVPSGVDASNGPVIGVAVRADATFCIQTLKIACVQYPAGDYCGRVFVVDAGIEFTPREIKRELVLFDVIGPRIQEAFRANPNVHKGSRGHVLVIGGSEGKFGAPQLTAQAALRSGSGLVTMLLPDSAARSVSPGLTELMCAHLDDGESLNFSGKGLSRLDPLLEGKDAVSIGTGMGIEKGAHQLLRETLSKCQKRSIPLVVDADALNLLAKDPDLRSELTEHTVLTPHPGEMARLLGISVGEVESNRLECARVSQEWNCWIVLKGARSIISGPSNKQLINPAATEALATAGSGDVLSGVIASFLGRGISIEDAIMLAVFIHGLSGETLAEHRGGVTGVVASDIIGEIPRVINALRKFEASSEGFFRCVLPLRRHYDWANFSSLIK